MKNQILNSILVRKPKRSNFDLSKTHLSTMKTGILYPTLCQDVVPGDKFTISANMFARAQALVAPAYVNVKMYNHFFFVPMQLVMSKWPDFLSGGSTGSVFPEKPYTYNPYGHYNNFIANGTLFDFIGFPTHEPDFFYNKIDLMPFKAYQLIYNEYYRDQNLQTEVDIDAGKVGEYQASSPEIAKVKEFLTLRRRNYAHDYFTSSLPWPQKGPSVTVPVNGIDIAADSGMSFVKGTPATTPVDGDTQLTGGMFQDSAGNVLKYDQGLKATNGNIDINALRQASRLQRFAEKLARGGSRYFEFLHSMFGVRPTDETLQRPQYLGGGVQQVMVSEVLQNSPTTGDDVTPLATQAGHAISAGSSNQIKFFAKEFGYIMCITSIMPEALYYQGLPKQFNKWDRFDYYFPEFDNLGEQEVSHKELYFDNSTELTPFGYLPRYAEYKTSLNTVHGDFRGNLSYWHAGRDVSSNHNLNEDFISTQDNALDKIFAVKQADADPFIVNIGFNVFANRPMSKYSTPIL